MPVKGVVKQDLPFTFYHVYNRVCKKQLFEDKQDYDYFFMLIDRYLGNRKLLNTSGRVYCNYSDIVEINCFCLMPTHFHLVVYQRESGALSGLMKSILGGYAVYYNKKYTLRGKLFESIYKSKPILLDNYLLHITRYIHLNPSNWIQSTVSSYQYYLGAKNQPKWLLIKRIIDMFPSIDNYKLFVESGVNNKQDTITMKFLLAE